MKTMEAMRRLLCPDDVSCMLCGAERGMGNETGLCNQCAVKLVAYDGQRTVQKTPLYAAFSYRGAVADLITGLKYENKRYMALPLVQGLVRVYREKGIKTDAVVPVPLHKKRLRTRGYNQSEVLASGLCERAGIPLMADTILRLRDTKQQVGLDENERMQNVQEAFSCTKELNGLRVILLDDVCTTGATMMACLKVLSEKGADVTLMAAATVDD